MGMTSKDKVSLHLICVGHLAHVLDRKHVWTGTFPFSSVIEIAPVWFVKRWESALTNKLTDWLTGFCVPVLALIMRLFRRQLHGLHPPHCLGAMSDLQLSMTGSYQGFGAGLCRVNQNIGCIVFIPAQRNSKRPRLGYHKSHTRRNFQMNTITHTHTQSQSWHLLLGSLGSNALSYLTIGGKLTAVAFGTLRYIRPAVTAGDTLCNWYLFRQLQFTS